MSTLVTSQIQNYCMTSDATGGHDLRSLYNAGPFQVCWLLDDACVVPWRSRGDNVDADSMRSISMRCSIDDLEEKWNARLVDAVPLQYLVCGAPWRDFLIYVEKEACLIPRPETEQLVEFVLEFEKERLIKFHDGASHDDDDHDHDDDDIWMDLGTGSGCIALSLAEELESQPSSVIALDASDLALQVAAINCERIDTKSVVELHQGDLRLVS